MKAGTRIILIILVTLLGSAAAFAQSSHPNWDADAVEVLKKMDAYTASMKQFQITAESYYDARLDELTVVSNPSATVLTVDRTGSMHSMHSATNDGLHTSEIYLHKGVLTLYSNKHNFYSRAEVPEDLEVALLFALEEFDVETPLLDFLILSSLDSLVSNDESVRYLTDKSPIRGVDCHHIIISGPHVDLQVWIEEGDRPIPRRTLMTIKTVHGLPRHDVFIDWPAELDPDASTFEFEPPDGALEIEFINSP